MSTRSKRLSTLSMQSSTVTRAMRGSYESGIGLGIARPTPGAAKAQVPDGSLRALHPLAGEDVGEADSGGKGGGRTGQMRGVRADRDGSAEPRSARPTEPARNRGVRAMSPNARASRTEPSRLTPLIPLASLGTFSRKGRRVIPAAEHY